MHTPDRQETRRPLYDVSIPTPTHAERARTLVSRISTGTLCALALEPEGYPYGSFVTVAFDEGHPIFLMSGLAEHTKNLERDPRASLLAAEGGADDPCTRVDGDGDRARAAFLAAHPNAGYYADFRDFAFWRLDVQAVQYIGGYGRMSWIDQADWLAAEPDPLAPSAASTLGHMNGDYADALVLYC
jgi:putative heme iron utilization protein